MAKKIDVVYGEETVELSRLYPFGETTKRGDQEVTVLRLHELNGFDQEIITKDPDKLYGYMQVAVSAGIEYSEALALAKKDYEKVIEVLEGF